MSDDSYNIPYDPDHLSGIEKLLEGISEQLARLIELQTPVKEKPRRPSGGGPKPLLEAYCEAYKKQYGHFPIVSPKMAGQAKTVLASVSLETAIQLVQAYLQMPDPYFKARCHDFGTFLVSIQKVAVAMQNGTLDPHERGYWEKIFQGGKDDKGKIQGANGQGPRYVEPKLLSGSPGRNFLEDFSE